MTEISFPSYKRWDTKIRQKYFYDESETILFEIFKPDHRFLFEVKVELKKKKINSLKKTGKWSSGNGFKVYKFWVDALGRKSLDLKHLHSFFNFFRYDNSIRLAIENNAFNYNILPENMTAEHLKEVSLPYNVKKVNAGEQDKLKKLKCWQDEYSKLREEDLKIFMDEEEILEIEKSLLGLRYGEKILKAMERSIYRWCIRGLSTKNAIKKELENQEKSHSIMLKHMKKKRK